MVDQRRIDDQRWVDSRTAARHLGIQQRSLYAYVSRGQVRSMPGAQGRPRLYSLADLDRLRVRRDARAGHGAVAAGAMRWGEPVLDSAITAITPRGPAYRGRLAIELAESGARFENVAELLWSGILPSTPVLWPRAAVPLAQLGKLVPYGARPLDIMPLLVQIAALGDPQRGDERPDAMIGRGRALIPLLAAALAPDFAAATVTRAIGAPSVAAIAARAIGLEDSAASILDVALIVLADHELNASSFAARIAASTDADPYACVSAALATVSGARHGSAAERIAQFADDIGSPENARAAMRALRKKGDTPPGFGHQLYPHGDPRAVPLLKIAMELVETSRTATTKRARTLLAMVEAGAGLRGDGAHDDDARGAKSRRAASDDARGAKSRRAASDDARGAKFRGATSDDARGVKYDSPAAADVRSSQPNVDLALAALIAAVGARPAAGSGLFALARSAGWLAHVIEQRAAGFLLRPRARYTGVPVP